MYPSTSQSFWTSAFRRVYHVRTVLDSGRGGRLGKTRPGFPPRRVRVAAIFGRPSFFPTLIMSRLSWLTDRSRHHPSADTFLLFSHRTSLRRFGCTYIVVHLTAGKGRTFGSITSHEAPQRKLSRRLHIDLGAPNWILSQGVYRTPYKLIPYCHFVENRQTFRKNAVLAGQS